MGRISFCDPSFSEVSFCTVEFPVTGRKLLALVTKHGIEIPLTSAPHTYNGTKKDEFAVARDQLVSHNMKLVSLEDEGAKIYSDLGIKFKPGVVTFGSVQGRGVNLDLCTARFDNLKDVIERASSQHGVKLEPINYYKDLDTLTVHS